MLRSFGHLTLGFFFASACTAAERPPPAPVPVSPPVVASLPGDLDVAVRFDVDWLTGELGPTLGQRLLLDVLVDVEDTSAGELLGGALRRTDLLWLGFRLGDSIQAAEKVLILRGHFPRDRVGLDVSDGTWSASPLERQWPHLYRRSAAPGALTRVYARGERLLIWASEAEAAPVEQMLDGVLDAAPLRPPERGSFSLSARPAPLRALYLRKYPQLAEHFAGASSLEGYLDSRAGFLELELELGFETATEAAGAGEILERLRTKLAGSACVIGAAAQAARLAIFEGKVRVLAQLGPGEVRGLEACVLGGQCCA